MTSPGSSTTQMISGSRRWSWQIRQRASSARLKQISHSPMRSLTSRIASASALASSLSARRMWKARRWAVRCPIPGSLPSSVMSLWTGGAYKRGCLEAREAQRAQVHAAGQAAELGLLELLGGPQGLVGGGEDHVLQQLGIVGIDRLGRDRDRLDHEIARDLDGDHPAARRGLDLLVLELLLGSHHVLLHLLDLLEHLLHVGRLRHQACPFRSSDSGSSSGTISSASKARLKRLTISSSLGGGSSTPLPRSRSS